jgi:hypothetical protein
MKLLTQAATPVVNTLADGYLSSVADTAVIDVSGLSNVSIYVNQVDDFAQLDLGTKTVNVDTVVRARVRGATPHVVFQAGAANGAGTITDIAGVVTVTFKTAVSTVTQIEALIATSTSIAVLTPGTGAHVLAIVDDDFTDSPLVLGAATFTVDVEKSSDGVNWSVVDSVTETDMPSGDNVAAELTLSDSHGMPTPTKQVRVTLSAMTGACRFTAVAAGVQI